MTFRTHWFIVGRHARPGHCAYDQTGLQTGPQGISTGETNHALDLVTELNQHEIANTYDVNTILRGNTLASKCMDVWMHLIGRGFLHAVLCPTISEVWHD
jgi:hypothetical protein